MVCKSLKFINISVMWFEILLKLYAKENKGSFLQFIRNSQNHKRGNQLMHLLNTEAKDEHVTE